MTCYLGLIMNSMFRQLGDWKGDVWKVAVELSSSKKCKFK